MAQVHQHHETFHDSCHEIFQGGDIQEIDQDKNCCQSIWNVFVESKLKHKGIKKCEYRQAQVATSNFSTYNSYVSAAYGTRSAAFGRQLWI